MPAKVYEAVAVQPLQSVVVTEYVPALKPERSSVVSPVDQEKAYAVALGSP